MYRMKLKQKIAAILSPILVIGISFALNVSYQPTASAVYTVGSGETCKDGSGAKSVRTQTGTVFQCEDITNTTTPAYRVNGAGDKCKDGSSPNQITVAGAGGRPQVAYQCAGGTADKAAQNNIPPQGEQDYMKKCQDSGKSQADCQAALDANKTGCQQQVNNNTYKNMDECLKRRAVYDYGICKDGSKPSISTGKCANGEDPDAPTAAIPNGGPASSGSGGDCAGVETAILNCNKKTGAEAIGDILTQAIRLLSLGVGIVAVGGIVFGAILYSSARDNASQTSQAIEVIRNTVIGIILYVFMVAIVNWLVPGGVIG